ncbi:stage II sporulation protein R [Clostridium amazonitimonense]|uniref:stage II sporulation protein R n=1 Tax=Clostridium amazonitimonense TaxID=1499689 RepID=UPI0005096066|nr:stage II sporulation protein R [Clostridium amazonitimonense]
MKKIIFGTVTVFILFLGCLAYGQDLDSFEKVDSDIIKDKVIRFHVIANSDSIDDQDVKLKVRDEILEYIYPKLENSKSLEESREILRANDEEMQNIAIKVLRANNYNYEVKSKLSNEIFPVKTYGSITLPQGEYEAYRLIIGEGKGQNWWCVMFPPLCFVDITKGEVSYKETENVMKKTLNEEEYNLIKGKTTGNVVFKSKIGEIFKEIKNKNK